MVTAENLPSGAALKAESLDFDRKVVASALDSRYGGGRALAEVTFGIQPLGYYLIKAAVTNEGETIARAESSYAVIVAPEKRRYDESSPFAMDMAGSWLIRNEKELRTASELVRLAGISCVRDRFNWSGIEPAKGTFRWSWYDTTARIQKEAGLTVYQVFHDCPRWASGKNDSRYPPMNPADLGDFFRNMVSQFKDKVKHWEIWNEADIDVFYRGKPGQYAACLKESYRRIKEADPEAKVLLCSFALGPGNFAEKIFREGIGDSFDIYNVHYYGDPIGLVHRLRNHRKLMEKFGVRKPIWVTEMGAYHRPGRGDHETLRGEASYLVKAYVYGHANGVERFFYFIFRDYTEDEKNFGVVNRDFTPRPAYVALCNLTYLLGEAKFVRNASDGEAGVECYVFADRQAEGAVLWADKTQDFRFHLKAARPEAVDIVGRSIPFRKFNEDSIEIRVGPEPVLVKGWQEK